MTRALQRPGRAGWWHRGRKQGGAAGQPDIVHHRWALDGHEPEREPTCILSRATQV